MRARVSQDAIRDAIARIKDEGMNRSQVMAHLSYLTDVIGPRLTGSPNLKRANEWTRDQMKAWGLQNAHLEAWGPFGRGWSLERFSAQVVMPQSIPLDAYPRAWSPGFRGKKVGALVYVDARDAAGLARFKGKLKGAFVVTTPPIPMSPHFEPEASRISDAQIREWEEAPPPPKEEPPPSSGAILNPQRRQLMEFLVQQARFFQEEGVVALLSPSYPPQPGTLFVEGLYVTQSPDTPTDRIVRARDKNAPPMIPQLVVATEEYNRLIRMLTSGEKITLEMELSATFHDRDLMAYNTIAEIPGTDRKEEVVMLGAHLDSWHGGTGATDDGVGVAACLEAVRILQNLNLRPRRTIRVGFWSGEEQGTLGSLAYVKQHLGTFVPGGAVRDKTLEYDRFSAYFHLDIGAGRVRGLFLNGNTAARPLLRNWISPLADLGVATATLASAVGSDHDNFDSIGLPAFMLIQDDLDYFTRTHHSSQDVFDRVPPDDAKQVATVMATLVYQAAMSDEKVPRKPL